MATYNYEDYLKKKGELGFGDGEISEADEALAKRDPDAGISLLTYKNDFKNAQTDTAKALAHANAEEIRARYGGYSGGGDGSGFALKPSDAVYESKWDNAIKEGLARMRASKFSFDPATDEQAQIYRDIYTREGKRAMQDTLGEVAARTGGNASSYATAAAAQVQNQYAEGLAEKYAELYDAAYDRYLTEYQRQASELSTLQGLEDTDYSRFFAQKELDLQKESAKAAAEQQAFENLLAERQLESELGLAWAELSEKQKANALEEARFALSIGDVAMLKKRGHDTATIEAALAQQYGTEEEETVDPAKEFGALIRALTNHLYGKG